MRIFLNNQPVELANDHMTVKDLMTWKNINPQGTAIAIDDKLLKKADWEITPLKELMNITVISAAFGG